MQRVWNSDFLHWILLPLAYTLYNHNIQYIIYTHPHYIHYGHYSVYRVLFYRDYYPAGALCKSCAPGCTSCEQSATNCLGCKESLVLYEHQCVKECPSAHTLQSGGCMPCPEGCLQCSAEGQCTSKENTPRNVTFLSFGCRFLSGYALLHIGQWFKHIRKL